MCVCFKKNLFRVCLQKHKNSIFLKTSYNILCKSAEWMKLFSICHTYWYILFWVIFFFFYMSRVVTTLEFQTYGTNTQGNTWCSLALLMTYWYLSNILRFSQVVQKENPKRDSSTVPLVTWHHIVFGKVGWCCFCLLLVDFSHF